MDGKGKLLLHKNVGFFSHIPQKKNYCTLNFLNMDAPMWGLVWWKTRMILEKWPDIKQDKLEVHHKKKNTLNS